MPDPSRSKDWQHFVDWCRAHQLRALPAHPWTVAAYARAGQGRARLPTVRRRVQTIARVHLMRCFSPPDRADVVQRTLAALALPKPERSPSLFRQGDFTAGTPPPPGADEAESEKSAETVPRRSLRGSPPLVRRDTDKQ